MQKRLEPRARGGVGEHASAAATRGRGSPSGRSDRGPNAVDHRSISGFAVRGHRVRRGVGVGDSDAERGKRARHFRLAAADAPREADDVGHRSGQGK